MRNENLMITRYLRVTAWIRRKLAGRYRIAQAAAAKLGVFGGMYTPPPPIIENFPLLSAKRLRFFKNFIILSEKVFYIPPNLWTFARPLIVRQLR